MDDKRIELWALLKLVACGTRPSVLLVDHELNFVCIKDVKVIHVEIYDSLCWSLGCYTLPCSAHCNLAHSVSFAFHLVQHIFVLYVSRPLYGYFRYLCDQFFLQAYQTKRDKTRSSAHWFFPHLLLRLTVIGVRSYIDYYIARPKTICHTVFSQILPKIWRPTSAYSQFPSISFGQPGLDYLPACHFQQQANSTNIISSMSATEESYILSDQNRDIYQSALAALRFIYKIW